MRTDSIHLDFFKVWGLALQTFTLSDRLQRPMALEPPWTFPVISHESS
jgi:hypothetical protein